MQGYELGKDIQRLSESVQQLEGLLRERPEQRPCGGCGSRESPAATLIGVIPTGIEEQIKGLPDDIKRELKETAKGRYKYIFYSPGPAPPVCGLVCISIYPQNSQCCWLNLYGKAVFGRMIGTTVVCGTSTIIYYVDEIEYCA
jgi:hypothetical protein